MCQANRITKCGGAGDPLCALPPFPTLARPGPSSPCLPPSLPPPTCLAAMLLSRNFGFLLSPALLAKSGKVIALCLVPPPLSPSAPPPWRTRLHLKMRRFWLLQYEIPQELKCIQYECLGHAATATATAAATAAEAAAQPAAAASTAIKHWPWPKPNVGARQE